MPVGEMRPVGQARAHRPKAPSTWTQAPFSLAAATISAKRVEGAGVDLAGLGDGDDRTGRRLMAAAKASGSMRALAVDSDLHDAVVRRGRET